MQIVEYCQELLKRAEEEGQKSIDFLEKKIRQCLEKIDGLREKQEHWEKMMDVDRWEEINFSPSLQANFSAPEIMERNEIKSVVDFNHKNNSFLSMQAIVNNSKQKTNNLFPGAEGSFSLILDHGLDRIEGDS